uniref:NADH-ubiquinone oxidoreductase chain 6 n=1 Tax=Melittomma sp. MEL01 TaxID=1205634 RepID=A0A0S2MPQ5_9CUCU|nr:NADH deshydrogenase subunit 6 [Melittomma sp. MEL01]
MMTMATIITSMFLTMNHPLTLGLMLITQTTMVSLITGSMSPSFWFSYIIFIIMVGGMLVIFIYMTSIASNEELSWNPMSIAIPILALPISWLTPAVEKANLEASNPQVQMNTLNKLINMPSNMMIILLIIYLLIALIAVVNISKSGKGPLRQN